MALSLSTSGPRLTRHIVRRTMEFKKGIESVCLRDAGVSKSIISSIIVHNAPSWVQNMSVYDGFFKKLEPAECISHENGGRMLFYMWSAAEQVPQAVWNAWALNKHSMRLMAAAGNGGVVPLSLDTCQMPNLSLGGTAPEDTTLDVEFHQLLFHDAQTDSYEGGYEPLLEHSRVSQLLPTLQQQQQQPDQLASGASSLA